MTRRGYSESDGRDFSAAALEVLRRAAEEASYLVDRAYPRESAISFVGNRYQLNARQRLLLARSVSGDIARRAREEKRLELGAMAGRTVSIDGFNALITLEVALCASPVVRCQDGTIRDLAGLRGTYHPVEQTTRAIGLMLDILEQHGAAAALFLLDAPVSNSGRLRELIDRCGTMRSMDVEARTIDLVDKALISKRDVVTSDSVILDGCPSWYNLDAAIIAGLDDVWLIDMAEA